MEEIPKTEFPPAPRLGMVSAMQARPHGDFHTTHWIIHSTPSDVYCR
jgi:hypothetical protein